jgi:hypothetical protein
MIPWQPTPITEEWFSSEYKHDGFSASSGNETHTPIVCIRCVKQYFDKLIASDISRSQWEPKVDRRWTGSRAEKVVGPTPRAERRLWMPSTQQTTVALVTVKQAVELP